MVTQYTKVHDYRRFLDLIVPQILPGSEYHVDVEFIFGSSNLLGEIEGCRRISRFYKGKKEVLALEISGIRYDSMEDVEEDRERDINSLISDIEQEVKKYFPNGIEMAAGGSFRLDRRLF